MLFIVRIIGNTLIKVVGKMYIFLNAKLYGLYKPLVYVANTFITTRPVLRSGRKPGTSRYLNLPPVVVHDCRSMFRRVSFYAISFCEILL